MSKFSRKREKALGLWELIAIALGGMVGGGIFSILGISVEQVGNLAPVAIGVGGGLAFLAAYSYVKLALLYKDAGATYSFFKKSFPKRDSAAAIVGWLIVFGYISTLALYGFTFASYFCSQFETLNNPIWQKIVAGAIIGLFVLINILSVKGMGKLEDVMVYTKILILLFISGLLATKGDVANLQPLMEADTSWQAIFIVAAITFVAYEGFQLIINAYDEMEAPQKNTPRAIYAAIGTATLLYVVLSVATLATIPKSEIIADKEYALAAGASEYLGSVGQFIVIFGALLATSSAISGTLFGASRLIAAIADDGFLPGVLGKKRKVHIPVYAILLMGSMSYILILSGGLQVILEFGSITFIIVSMLMAYANYRKRKETHSSKLMTLLAISGLLIAGLLIFYFEFTHNRRQLFYILGIYGVLAVSSYLYARKSLKSS
jgi:amino acid transporter